MSKQKILFLLLSYHTVEFFKPVIRTLLKQGHEVRVIATEPLPFGAQEDGFDTHRAQWHIFDWTKIESFGPTRIITFNGYFRPIHAAVCALKRKYPMLLAEVAWFPQNNFIYLDKDIHHRATLAGETIKSDRYKEVFDLLPPAYPIKQDIPIELPKDFVLVPMQLERDTSILYASPYFKDMNSLIGFVRHHLPKEANVVIKAHPKSGTDETEEMLKTLGCTVIDNPEVSMTDLVARAHLVVGINSTSLMEALILDRPVICLGNNVAGHEGLKHSDPFIRGHIESFDMHKVYYNPTEYMPTKETIQQRIAYLYVNQIDFRKPPEWVVERILSGDTTPRTVDDFLAGRGMQPAYQ